MALHTCTLPNAKDITQPIPIILDGSNYPAWSQNMSRWLNGHCLLKYVSSEEPKPITRIAKPTAAFLLASEHGKVSIVGLSLGSPTLVLSPLA